MRTFLIMLVATGGALATTACERSEDCVGCADDVQGGMSGEGGMMPPGTGGMMPPGTGGMMTPVTGGMMTPVTGGMMPTGGTPEPPMGGTPEPPPSGRCPPPGADENGNGEEDRFEPDSLFALCDILYECLLPYCETAPREPRGEFIDVCTAYFSEERGEIVPYCEQMDCEETAASLEVLFRGQACSEDPPMRSGMEIPRASRAEETGPTVCVEVARFDSGGSITLDWPPPPTQLARDMVWMGCNGNLHGGAFAVHGLAAATGTYDFMVDNVRHYEDPRREVDPLDLVMSIGEGGCVGGD